MPRVLFGRVQSKLLLLQSSALQPNGFLAEPLSQTRALCILISVLNYHLMPSHPRWIAKVGKAEALAKAGVMLPPSGSKEVKDVPEAIQKDQGSVRAVAFNVVGIIPFP
jgi:hypothetical protein